MSKDAVLPDGWASTTLSEIGAWVGGITPDKSNASYWHQGSIPWISPKDMKCLRIVDSEDHITPEATRETNVKSFPAGTVLVVVRSGILIRKLPVAVCDVSATMNQDMKGIIPLQGVNSLYIAYYLIAHERSILNSCCKDGTTVASIEAHALKSYPFLLPPPNEQGRIVAKIDELFSDLDAGVAALERARANLKRYRAAVLKAAVEGKLTEQWRAEHPATEPASKLLERILTERGKKWEVDQLAKYAATGKTPPKDWGEKYNEPAGPGVDELPKLPKGWCWVTVDQLAEVGTGTTPSRSVSNYYRGGTVPWIMSAAVNKLWVTEASEFVTEQALQETTLRLYPRHTLIIALYGEGKTRGKVSELAIDATINQALAALVTSDVASGCRQYLKVFLLSNYDRLRRQSAGGMQPNLNLGLVKKIVVPLVPVAEQEQIVAEVEQRLSVIVVTESQIEANLQRAVRLRQSILKQAFEGKLVAQDPADEPASVLLGRIRESRETELRIRPAAKMARKAPAASGVRRKQPAGNIFRRGAVVCYVIQALKDRPSFGRIQLAKVLHLTQAHLGVDLALEFERYPAGPLDTAIYKLEGFAKKQGWFDKEDRPSFGVRYRPGPNISERCEAAVAILGEKRAGLDELLAHVAGMDADAAELFATVYAAWNDLLIDGKAASEEAIIAEVYGWDESKKRFPEARITRCMAWMRKHGCVPTGTGQRTQLRSPVSEKKSQRGRKKP